ncbi:MAG: hypothetical protein M3Y07_09375, partial [Acidobacteriota bacterium]|nr:hypothetical protein [Acidobacteriota bacterium]
MATEESCVRIRRKTIVGVATLVVTNLCGNTALGVGMQQTGPLNGIAAVWNMVSNPWVIAGVLILFVWMISQALVLSWADLSFILPMTAVSY